MELPRKIFGTKTPIIDVHVHTFFKNTDHQEIAAGNKARFDIEGLKQECAANNVQHICSIYNDFERSTPIDIAALREQRATMPSIIGVGILHPTNVKKDSLKVTETAIADGTLKALKVYPGYYEAYCTDKRFHPYYKLAAKYNIPVYVHAGDMIGRGARLRYARPLHVDEIAVDFPDTNFIITQLGNPWFIDAAEVAYKNDNVYLDTAGLFSGMSFSKLYNDRIAYVIDYIEDPRKFLYGSDWPMVRMKEYIAFMQRLLPKEMHAKVFYENARRLFKV